jgi:hypothetical protein
MVFRLKWWYIPIAVVAIVGGFSFGCPGWTDLSPFIPPGLYIPSIVDDTLSRASMVQGTLISSGTIRLYRGTEIRNNFYPSDENVILPSHTCVGFGSSLTSFTVISGADSRVKLMFDVPNNICVPDVDELPRGKIRAFCYWDASQLKQKVLDLNIGIDSITCPSDYPTDSTEDTGCMIGFTQG